jgi:hypothetical protein
MGVTLAILWDLIYEVLAVEAADSLAANAACHDRNAMHIRFGDHGLHGGVYILIGELSRNVVVKDLTELLKLVGLFGSHCHFTIS